MALVQGQSPQLLVTWWQLAYWYGFAAQFTLLPFHQEYADSGHFTVGDRINTAIRNNLIFYAVLVVRPLTVNRSQFGGIDPACKASSFSRMLKFAFASNALAEPL